jgi:hypothetical protein
VASSNRCEQVVEILFPAVSLDPKLLLSIRELPVMGGKTDAGLPMVFGLIVGNRPQEKIDPRLAVCLEANESEPVAVFKPGGAV